MKEITALTNEYASNLNCLVINFNGKLASRYTILKKMFKKCTVVDSIDNTNILETIDVVFIRIDDNSPLVKHKDFTNYFKRLRSENELLEVYLVLENITDTDIKKSIKKCFCADGYLESPFDKNQVYKLLFRNLKRVTAEKTLKSYISILENMLYDSSTNKKEDIKEVATIQATLDDKRVLSINKKRKKDLRSTQIEKISALEFVNSLDDTIMDKIEDFSEELDELNELLNTLNALDTDSSLHLLLTASANINHLHTLIDNMGVFPIIARALEELTNFLNNLTEAEINQKENKNMLGMLLIGIMEDLEKWIDVIFITRSTDDIHYFDSSFFSNMLELENIFIEDEARDEEDILEFF